jgi:hypothetical protein
MDPVGIALTIGALATGVAGVAYIVRGVWRGSRAITRLADDLLGDPKAGKLGVVKRLDGIDRRLAAVEHQVNPNSGTSMHDKVNQIRESVTS